MTKFLGFVVLALSFSAFSQSMFIIKKNVNPKNVLYLEGIIKNCKFNAPFITPYWLMGERGGNIEGLNFLERSFFTPRIKETNESEVKFTLGAFDKFNLGESQNIITARLVNCIPKAFVYLDGDEIELREISAIGHFGLRGWRTHSLKINGFHNDGTDYNHKFELLGPSI